ncbi:hypothetical protein C491_13687 [Natronococcus amylolyticus DSM 10524]|uniref:Uncharacterized protein n=1 Tax=Natronococcus amylolyticus DSM 10524 TaxID=1227497 RepID=L9X340_9EURY|nr:hypothetical protein [Natronococcus amylolyticus]ELY56007.1 hypothetical protein C491_13687 [Natronococcus amylolyticus DSM 10524]
MTVAILEQIRNHLSGLRQEASDTQRLVVLTPDHSRPSKLDRIEDERLVWTNFDQLVDAAESILARDHGSAEQSLEIPPNERHSSFENSFASSTRRTS